MALKIIISPVEPFLKREADISVQIYCLFLNRQPSTLLKFKCLCGNLRLLTPKP